MIHPFMKFVESNGYKGKRANEIVKKMCDARRHPTKGWRGPKIGIIFLRAFIEQTLSRKA